MPLMLVVYKTEHTSLTSIPCRHTGVTAVLPFSNGSSALVSTCEH